MQLLAKLKRILYMAGVQEPPYIFRKFEMALNPPFTEFFSTLPKVASHPTYQNSVIR